MLPSDAPSDRRAVTERLDLDETSRVDVVRGFAPDGDRVFRFSLDHPPGWHSRSIHDGPR